MNHPRKLTLCFGLALAAGSCSPVGNYLTDRVNDAADVFSATAGLGLGASARLGPFHAGYFGGQDALGLRGGEFLRFWVPWSYNGTEQADCPVMFSYPLYLLYGEGEPSCLGGFDYFAPDTVLLSDRNKDFNAFSSIPFFYSFHRRPGPVRRGAFAHQYSQVEVVGGFFITLRIGSNPGEFLDFLLGWVGLDLYGDDVGWDKQPPIRLATTEELRAIRCAIQLCDHELGGRPPQAFGPASATIRGKTAIARCFDFPTQGSSLRSGPPPGETERLINARPYAETAWWEYENPGFVFRLTRIGERWLVVEDLSLPFQFVP